MGLKRAYDRPYLEIIPGEGTGNQKYSVEALYRLIYKRSKRPDVSMQFDLDMGVPGKSLLYCMGKAAMFLSESRLGTYDHLSYEKLEELLPGTARRGEMIGMACFICKYLLFRFLI